uniref:Arrestin C-terminal-like domain-containing protein n=1 Tax=Timema cristinae TaxID=61476 RepID=A0A7R9D0Y3_TIMCR|nr:unnamed protein product [Timema cristinae]
MCECVARRPRHTRIKGFATVGFHKLLVRALQAELFFSSLEHLFYEIQTSWLTPLADTETVLPAGDHSFLFTFSIPSNLPSSFEGAFGYIRYSIKAILDRPWKFNQDTKVALTVLAYRDLNMYPQLRTPLILGNTKTICCWCCQSAPMAITARVPFTGFVPGQDVPLIVELDNPTSVDITSVQCYLMQCHLMQVTSSLPESPLLELSQGKRASSWRVGQLNQMGKEAQYEACVVDVGSKSYGVCRGFLKENISNLILTWIRIPSTCEYVISLVWRTMRVIGEHSLNLHLNEVVMESLCRVLATNSLWFYLNVMVSSMITPRIGKEAQYEACVVDVGRKSYCVCRGFLKENLSNLILTWSSIPSTCEYVINLVWSYVVILESIFYARGKSRTETRKLGELTLDPVGKHSSHTAQKTMRMPSCPPTLDINCGIIKIHYFIEINYHKELNFDFRLWVSVRYVLQCKATTSGAHMNLYVATPLTVGTVPLIFQQTWEPLLPGQDGPPTVPPTAPPYPDLPPPSYDECVFGAISIREDEDSEHTYGQKQFSPRYPTYNL